MNKTINHKENVMKTLNLLLVAVLSTAVFAQTPEQLDNAARNYIQALKSDNDGMVESAIFHCLKFNLFYPDRDTNAMVTELNTLVKSGNTDTIRYKAFLALEYFRSQKLKDRIIKADYKDAGQFFRMLNHEINKQVLAIND
jgi:hypothetical protein